MQNYQHKLSSPAKGEEYCSDVVRLAVTFFHPDLINEISFNLIINAHHNTAVVHV